MKVQRRERAAIRFRNELLEMKKAESREHLPLHLREAYDLLEKIFSEGIPDEYYYPFIAAIYEEMSDRALARLIWAFTGEDYGFAMNNVYEVGGALADTTLAPGRSHIKIDRAKVAQVEAWLEANNFQDWLNRPISSEATEN